MADIQPGDDLTLGQRAVEQRSAVGHGVAIGVDVVHADQGDAGLAPVNLQLQRAIGRHGGPGRGERADQLCADAPKARAVPLGTGIDGPVSLADQPQGLRARAQCCRQYPRTLLEPPLRAAQRQRLQLALLLDLQRLERAACAVVIDGQPTKQQRQQEAADAQNPARVGGAGHRFHRERGPDIAACKDWTRDPQGVPGRCGRLVA
ncbi:hypothetical protein [Stutzerimonas chloritidismutans]|uniref:hypothetical protein n=1 Tax=Stutzerimonas chloritidismutans TaxID=203192 RepID=UPI003F5CCF08